MAIKVTVEKVAEGTLDMGSHQVKATANLVERLPITVVLSDAVCGPLLLKAVMDICLQNKLNTDITTSLAGNPTLAEVIVFAHLEHVTP